METDIDKEAEELEDDYQAECAERDKDDEYERSRGVNNN